MGRAHVRAHGIFPPEQFLAALTDFGADRSGIRGDSSTHHLAGGGQYVARDLRRSVRRIEARLSSPS